jgi:type II secretory pathway predicted ATPase ExeA
MTRAPWVTHFGFTRTPLSKNIPAKDLLERVSHQEAVARIRFCIAESSLGVITGEVGVGKTGALRAAVSQLDQAAHHIVYLANPTVGIRGLYVTIVRALGAVPRGFKAELIAQAQDLLPPKSTNAADASSSWSMRRTCWTPSNWRSYAC